VEEEAGERDGLALAQIYNRVVSVLKIVQNAVDLDGDRQGRVRFLFRLGARCELDS
jgi:hypothetical protein